LKLDPAPSFDYPIRCSLEEVSLDTVNDDENGYEALSYVWGYKKGDREVICEGKTLLVTRNCEEALRTLREKNVTRRLWVDAICIDQTEEVNELREKSHQIKFMGEIYSRAEHVVVWLGASDHTTARGMKYLEKLAKYSDMMTIGSYPQRLYGKMMLKRSSKRLAGESL
jgi:hypothetical protein